MFRLFLAFLLVTVVSSSGGEFVEVMDDLIATLKEEVLVAEDADSTDLSLQRQLLGVRVRLVERIKLAADLAEAAWPEKVGFDRLKFRVTMIRLTKAKEQYLVAIEHKDVTRKNGIEGLNVLLKYAQTARSLISI